MEPYRCQISRRVPVYNKVKTSCLRGSRPLLDSLARDFDLRLYRFDEHARAVSREELASLTPDGRATDIMQSVLDVQQEYRGHGRWRGWW